VHLFVCIERNLEFIKVFGDGPLNLKRGGDLGMTGGVYRASQTHTLVCGIQRSLLITKLSVIGRRLSQRCGYVGMAPWIETLSHSQRPV